VLYIDNKDIDRLAFEVRRFLNKGDFLTRLSGMATLYLEFPDVGTMHNAHKSIVQALPPNGMRPDGCLYEYIDDHTIRIEPIAGIAFVLSCKQRFATTMGGSLGYLDIAFKTAELPKMKP